MNCRWSEVQLSVVGLAVNACAHGDQAGSQARGCCCGSSKFQMKPERKQMRMLAYPAGLQMMPKAQHAENKLWEREHETWV